MSLGQRGALPLNGHILTSTQTINCWCMRVTLKDEESNQQEDHQGKTVTLAELTWVREDHYQLLSTSIKCLVLINTLPQALVKDKITHFLIFIGV